jgi:hypothetical protein
MEGELGVKEVEAARWKRGQPLLAIGPSPVGYRNNANSYWLLAIGLCAG